MLAGFLVAMPLVYVMGWFAARDHAASSWIWVELLGLALFAAFAALGLKNWPWFLAIGIAGHRFAWDHWWWRPRECRPKIPPRPRCGGRRPLRFVDDQL
jgi:hypothetical protein